jgi:putative nucleotidyltransferase with HDIG domain
MKTLTQPRKGLRLVKPALEGGSARFGTTSILSGKDGDLLEHSLAAGQNLTLSPATSVSEVVYLLEGNFSLNGHEVSEQLLCSDQLTKVSQLKATNAAKLLHFSTPAGAQLSSSTALHFDSGSLKLLYASSSTELSLMTLKNNMRFFIVPNETPDQPVSEVYYLLEGQLSFQGGTVLSQGDYIVAEGLEEPVAFHGLSNVTMLYFSLQPNFKDVGQDADELMHLADTIEQKDGYTANHCKRIQDFSLKTAEVMGLSHDRLYLLNYGAYLHDIGKARLPEGLLQKPGKLTSEEWVIMKQHPTMGRELLEHSFLHEVGAIVEQHHERLDGSGYPKGLEGLEISLEAYIIAVADTFDAITTDRPYRAALPISHALSELRKYADQHYPREVVEAFITANLLE